jgi:predicted phage terminase large subunit-like protein
MQALSQTRQQESTSWGSSTISAQTTIQRASLAPSQLAKLATNNRYRRPPHIALMERAFLELVGREYRWLLLNLPPRHGKSEYISAYAAAWYILMHPTHKVIFISYGDEYAGEWGERARDLVEVYGHLFGVAVKQDHRAKDNWQTTAGGGMVSTGIGGTITGRGADLLIIDDPHKNSEEALSKTMRDKVWAFWQSTVNNRLEPGGICIVIQTRWHQDDLTGRLLADKSTVWRHVNLPALALAGDPLGRKEGEALWPWRYPVDELHRLKARSGSFWWSALFQQAPVPLGETMFRPQWAGTWEWSEDGDFILYTRPGEESPRMIGDWSLVRFGMMDLAASIKERSDYTVLTSWALSRAGDLFLLDVDRRQLEAPDQTKMMRAALDKHGLSFIGVESVAYQLSLSQYARRERIPVKKVTAKGDKVARALTASTIMEAGQLYFPKWASWMPEVEAELYNFPGAAHDDIVDTVAYAAIYATAQAVQGTFA